MSRFSFSGRLPSVLMCVVGGLCLIVGLVVIVGWHINSPSLVQLRPAWPSQKYNTAICFLLTGTAFIGLCFGKTLLTTLAGGATAVIALLTISQYALGINLG